MAEDTTEILVDESSGKSIAEALREFWRAHSVTMGKKDWTRDDLYDRWKWGHVHDGVRDISRSSGLDSRCLSISDSFSAGYRSVDRMAFGADSGDSPAKNRRCNSGRSARRATPS